MTTNSLRSRRRISFLVSQPLRVRSMHCLAALSKDSLSQNLSKMSQNTPQTAILVSRVLILLSNSHNRPPLTDTPATCSPADIAQSAAP